MDKNSRSVPPELHKKPASCIGYADGSKVISELDFELYKLRRDMRGHKYPHISLWIKNTHNYRQRFCYLVRKHSGFSREELCKELNSHHNILNLEKHSRSFKKFFPITPQFLRQLETEGGLIGESGCVDNVLDKAGIPLNDISITIAEICGVTRKYKVFIDWCIECRFSHIL